MNVRRTWKFSGLFIAFLLLVLWRQFGPGLPVDVTRRHDEIAAAFTDQRSGLMLEFDARVLRILTEAAPESPQQRFVVELDNGHVLLVVHDLERAAAVPLAPYDLVRIRGEYQWNEQGGEVHWTHRDPGFGLKHGWIEHKGKRYD
jgi:hypothetical protein